jgi:hypothetical protein
VKDEEVRALVEEFGEVFRTVPPGLPPDRGIGHTIPLESGHSPPWRPVYRLSVPEKEELSKQLKELLTEWMD